MVLFGLALSGPAVWLPEASFIGKLWLKLRSVQIPVETSGSIQMYLRIEGTVLAGSKDCLFSMDGG